MKVKIIFKFLTFKMLVKLFLSLCLVYQTYVLIEQYLKFNSIINIKFTTNIMDKLPGITFCYNRILSFEKLAQHYSEYEEVYQSYSKMIMEFSEDRYAFNRS